MFIFFSFPPLSQKKTPMGIPKRKLFYSSNQNYIDFSPKKLQILQKRRRGGERGKGRGGESGDGSGRGVEAGGGGGGCGRKKRGGVIIYKFFVYIFWFFGFGFGFGFGFYSCLFLSCCYFCYYCEP